MGEFNIVHFDARQVLASGDAGETSKRKSASDLDKELELYTSKRPKKNKPEPPKPIEIDTPESVILPPPSKTVISTAEKGKPSVNWKQRCLEAEHQNNHFRAIFKKLGRCQIVR